MHVCATGSLSVTRELSFQKFDSLMHPNHSLETQLVHYWGIVQYAAIFRV